MKRINKHTILNHNKQVEPYLNYYLGAQYHYECLNGEYYVAKMEMISDWGFLNGTALNIGPNAFFEIDPWIAKGKLWLVLTDPTDMTSEQKGSYKDLCYKCEDSNGQLVRIVDTPESLHFLFKNHIDAFDLIEKGVAIDINCQPVKYSKLWTLKQ